MLVMASRAVYTELGLRDAGPFEPRELLPDGLTLDTNTRGGVKQFINNTLKTADGTIQVGTVREFITELAEYSEQHTPYSAQPFRYAALPNLPDIGLTCTAEDTVAAAVDNMRSLTSWFDPRTFAATKNPDGRGRQRTVQWRAGLDNEYEIRLRGGSGAGTFSLDLGLGTYDPSRPYKYNELWRNGIDTVSLDGETIVRFIRTGSGVKPGDTTKQQAFDRFRKVHGMLPQRLLAILGLYYARELEPVHAVAMTTEGARKLSTLGNSAGNCDYTGIFRDVGFTDTSDTNWSAVANFSSGFYDALSRARIRRREADALDTAVHSLNEAKPVNCVGRAVDITLPIQLCSDGGSKILEKELAVYAAA